MSETKAIKVRSNPINSERVRESAIAISGKNLFCFLIFAFQIIIMGKGKLVKWEENLTFEHVHEPNLQELIEGATYMKGEWCEKVFGNSNPIVLELGCGKGEYTVGLARMYPNINFLGVDAKGHRFWRGAKTSKEEGLNNVAFLRTRIEFIEAFFAKDEVDEIWLTFSDPQPKNDSGTKRITGPYFLDRYKKFTKEGALIHVKTDNKLLYKWTLEQLQEKKYDILEYTDDVYGDFLHRQDETTQKILQIKTYYERLFIEYTKTINYIKFRL